MPLILAALVAALFSLSSATATAGDSYERSGTTLLNECSYAERLATNNEQGMTGSNLMLAVRCQAYIQGIADGAAAQRQVHAELHTRDPQQPNVVGMICVPSTETVNQLVLVVTKHLRDHPATLHEDRASLVVRALADAFPCTTR